MSWYKKGTRHSYDNSFDRSYLISYRTGKLICMLVYSKKCTTCDDISTYNLPEGEEYYCPYNYHSSSSKEIEAGAVFDMVVQLW